MLKVALLEDLFLGDLFSGQSRRTDFTDTEAQLKGPSYSSRGLKDSIAYRGTSPSRRREQTLSLKFPRRRRLSFYVRIIQYLTTSET